MEFCDLDKQEIIFNKALPTDKNDRPIMLGDILKVFHFIGERGKKYFMYKQVVSIKNNGGDEYYRISHLSLRDKEDGYYIKLGETKYNNIEIVQSCSKIDFEYRPKIKRALTEQD